MPDLPARPDFGQLRRQAKDLLRAATSGDADALRRIRAVSDRLVLASAQLAVAREYGFASWPKLRIEVLRREVLNSADAARLRALLGDQLELAVTRMEHWCDHPKGASPLGYVAMLRYDTSSGIWRDVPGADMLARALIEAGAPVDGEPGRAGDAVDHRGQLRRRGGRADAHRGGGGHRRASGVGCRRGPGRDGAVARGGVRDDRRDRRARRGWGAPPERRGGCGRR